MQIHELNNFSGTPGASDYFATDNGTDTSKISANDLYAPLNARIDNIIAGPTSSAEEVVDARLGAQGLGSITYSSLGAAVRGQAEELLKGMQQIILSNGYLRNCKTQLFKRGVYYTTPAVGAAVVETPDATYSYACIFDVIEGETIIINASASTGNARLYVFIDADGKALNRCATNLSGVNIVTVPQGAVQMAVNNVLSRQASGFFVISGSLSGDAFIATEIEQGTYYSSTGEKGFSTGYCRTPKYKFDDVIEVNIPVNRQYFVWRYDANGNFISRDGSTSSRRFSKEAFKTAYEVSGAVYFAISISISENTTPELVEGSGFAVKLNSKQLLYDKITEVIDSLALTASRDLVSYVSKDFEQGGLNSSGGEGTSFVYCRTPFVKFNSLVKLYKPIGVTIIVCMYDANHGFLDRTSFVDTTETTLEGVPLSNALGKQGQTAYIRISVKRVVNGEEVESMPEDIINSGLAITLVGASEDVYEQIYEIKGMMDDDNAGLPSYYEPYITNKINTINTLEDGNSLSDNFIFITDYHYTKNAQNSPKLIRKIVEETGITKLFFGGDAGVSAPLASMYRAARDNGKVYQKLWDSAPHFYGMIGNHEWNDRQDETHESSQQPEVYNREGVYNFYISREEQIVKGMSSEGNYYIDNDRANIRYFFLQSTGQAKITNETVKWLGDQLAEVPNGWYVIALNHYAYTGGVTGTDSMTGRGNLSVLRISQLLGALKNGTTVTVNQYANTGETTGTYTFDYSDKSVTPIAIVSGHTHWDASLTVAQSVYGILTVATTTDAFGYAQNPLTHVLEPRQVGTTDEQAFDVVQIDLTARKLYMTRIGGGSDREFTF